MKYYFDDILITLERLCQNVQVIGLLIQLEN